VTVACFVARRVRARLPLRLRIRPDALRDPVDVVEVRDHLDQVVDRRVVEAVRAERFRVSRPDGRRLESELARVVAERARALVEVSVAVVVLRVPRKLVCGALVTEVVGVRSPSVATLVYR
jgi:hypothetical protein